MRNSAEEGDGKGPVLMGNPEDTLFIPAAAMRTLDRLWLWRLLGLKVKSRLN